MLFNLSFLLKCKYLNNNDYKTYRYVRHLQLPSVKNETSNMYMYTMNLFDHFAQKSLHG